MNRILFLLLFIPIISCGQSYKDIMSINSLDNFKRVVIENDYEIDKVNQSGVIKYKFVKVIHNETMRTGSYNPKNNLWEFSFVRSVYDFENEIYDLIVDNIKRKCDFHKIMDMNGVDFSCYDCTESKYNGKIGFVVNDGSGIIKLFPPSNN